MDREKAADRERLRVALAEEGVRGEMERRLKAEARQELVDYYSRLSQEAELREQRALWRQCRLELGDRRKAFLEGEGERLRHELEQGDHSREILGVKWKSSDQPSPPSEGDLVALTVQPASGDPQDEQVSVLDNQTASQTDDGTAIRTDDGTNLQTDDGAALQTDDGAALQTDDGAALQTDDGTALQTDDGAALQTDDGAALQTDDGTTLQTDDGAALQTDDGAALQTDDGTTLQTDDGTTLQTDDGAALQTDDGTALQTDGEAVLQVDDGATITEVLDETAALQTTEAEKPVTEVDQAASSSKSVPHPSAPPPQQIAATEGGAEIMAAEEDTPTEGRAVSTRGAPPPTTIQHTLYPELHKAVPLEVFRSSRGQEPPSVAQYLLYPERGWSHVPKEMRYIRSIQEESDVVEVCPAPPTNEGVWLDCSVEPYRLEYNHLGE